MKMKDNPDLWSGLVAGAKAIWPVICGPLIAAAVCYARLIHDGVNRKNKWIEASLCGLLAYSVSCSIDGAVIFGWHVPKGFDVLIGASIGFLGVDTIRDYALRYMNKKAGDIEKND